jgi:hypothetical protein
MLDCHAKRAPAPGTTHNRDQRDSWKKLLIDVDVEAFIVKLQLMHMTIQ